MRQFWKYYRHNVSPGPSHVSLDKLPLTGPDDYPVRYIAYYLPQFHAIEQNDRWWGPGFTEWTNTTKAMPRYLGHYQPRLPADLGFYDASRADTLRRQAELARRGGIYGFCIHNYWFSGQKLLERPLQTLLDNPDIDLRFCLNWANENWSRRWDGSEQDVMMEQRYLPEDPERYVDSIAAAVRDPRYIRIAGRPLLMVYRPSILPDAAAMFDRWRRRFATLALGNPFLVMAQSIGDADPRPLGLDAAAGFPPHGGGWNVRNDRPAIKVFDPGFSGTAMSYDALAATFERLPSVPYRQFPGVCPGWDNEPRKHNGSQSFYGATPGRYGRWLRQASERAASADQLDERIVFINAWNEWAEGAYLEPDRHFGAAYLRETRLVLDEVAGKPETPRQPTFQQYSPRRSWHHWLRNKTHAVGRRLERS